MSDTSNIDSEKILSTCNQLDGVVDRMDGYVMKFAEAIERLDKGWVSEIKAGFMANYQKDLEAMQEMISQLRELTNMLRDAASDFDKTEEDIYSDIGSLG
ncbi:MAG: hypothetical protein LBJ64_09355 [Deltaproteobacteria bacterium]|jgi:uncharacterized protein YukE|nr:hypothetical protein [Deltaproteobacteria bacterium]